MKTIERKWSWPFERKFPVIFPWAVFLFIVDIHSGKYTKYTHRCVGCVHVYPVHEKVSVCVYTASQLTPNKLAECTGPNVQARKAARVQTFWTPVLVGLLSMDSSKCHQQLYKLMMEIYAFLYTCAFTQLYIYTSSGQYINSYTIYMCSTCTCVYMELETKTPTTALDMKPFWLKNGLRRCQACEKPKASQGAKPSGLLK